jgi:hypothetical protein
LHVASWAVKKLIQPMKSGLDTSNESLVADEFDVIGQVVGQENATHADGC